MPLIKCPNCGQSISDKAVNCPKCGAPLHQNLNNWIPQGVNDQNPYGYNPNQMPVKNNRKSNNSLLIIIITSVFIVVLSIIGGFFYVYHNKKTNFYNEPIVNKNSDSVTVTNSNKDINSPTRDTTVNNTSNTQPPNVANSPQSNAHHYNCSGDMIGFPIKMKINIDNNGNISGTYKNVKYGTRMSLSGTQSSNGTMNITAQSGNTLFYFTLQQTDENDIDGSGSNGDNSLKVHLSIE